MVQNQRRSRKQRFSDGKELLKEKEKKKYTPEVLNTFKFRGFRIREIFNRKTRRREFKCRFQINNKEINLTGDTRKALEEMIDEVVYQERRAKYDLPVEKSAPTVEELFAAHTARLKKEANRKKISLFARASTKLLEILPPRIKTSELKKAHFQKYIDARLAERNSQSKEFILPESVNKELSAISVAFKNAHLFFAELENAPVVEILKAKEPKDRHRERLVDKEAELAVLLEFLRRPHRHSKTTIARRNLADDLEIRYETGLRRGEVALLKKHQYLRDEIALRDVYRIKTDTTTRFFPLSRRAREIIESRLDSASEYIFSNAGKPSESAYRTLKNVCAKLGINYGTNNKGGFVPHDLRRNFASRMIEKADIKTVSELLGHSSTTHTQVYLQTNKGRLIRAVRAGDDADSPPNLAEIYNAVKGGKMDIADFIKRMEFLIKNG